MTRGRHSSSTGGPGSVPVPFPPLSHPPDHTYSPPGSSAPAERWWLILWGAWVFQAFHFSLTPEAQTKRVLYARPTGDRFKPTRKVHLPLKSH